MHDTSSTPEAIRASLRALLDAQPASGELIYFTGHLAEARVKQLARRNAQGGYIIDAGGNFIWDFEPVEPLNTVAQFFEDEAEAGRVFLFQTRSEGGQMRYVARKRVSAGNHTADGRGDAAGRIS